MSVEDVKKKIAELYLKDGIIPTNAGLQVLYEKIQEYIKKAAQETFGEYFQDNTNPKDFIARSADNISARKSHTQSVMVLMQELENLMKK